MCNDFVPPPIYCTDCFSLPLSSEDTAEAIAVDCLGQPKSPLEKFMVRLCTYHQKHFVRVLNDMCTEVQPGCEGQQLPGPENMDMSTCSSGCSQYRIENQELGISCSESKLPLSPDSEQSGPHGSLRILCHALKQAVDLKSTDRRENCSPVVRRDFPEFPSMRLSSATSRESPTPTQGYLTASNSHHSTKSLEGQTPDNEQEMAVKKGEDDKDQLQARGYVAAKVSHLNSNEDSLGSQKNPFKAFPEETRDPAFATSSPRRADKENSLQCSSKASLHQDTETNDQEARAKVETHLQTLGKSKGSYHIHPGDMIHLENGKEGWLPDSPVPVGPHKATNGHSRARSISAATKSMRKNKRSSGLRINDYDNQCDVVYISQPITECHFESKRTMSSRKTARKSTRGYYYNGECCELPTVRTLAKASHVQESWSSLSPRPEVLTGSSQGLALPGSSHVAAAHTVGGDGDKRPFLVALPQVDSSNKETQGRAENNSAESNSLEVNFVKPTEASPAVTPTLALSTPPCPVLDADEGSLAISSLQATVGSSPQHSEEGELQNKSAMATVLRADSCIDSSQSNSPNEENDNAADSVSLSVSEASDGEKSSVFLENEGTIEPSGCTEHGPLVNMAVPASEEPAARMDLPPPLEDSVAGMDLPTARLESLADVEPPPLSPVELPAPPALVTLDSSVAIPEELPSNIETVCSGELVESLQSLSPLLPPVSLVPEVPAVIGLEPSEPLSRESPVMHSDSVDLTFPQPHCNSDPAELPGPLQSSDANGSLHSEPSVDGTQSWEEGQPRNSEAEFSSADIGENGSEGTINTSKTGKIGEGIETDGKAPPVAEGAEIGDKGASSSKPSPHKKRKREKKTHATSDRCLRSQQPLSPSEDNLKQPSSLSPLQLPQLQIKLSKSPGAKRFKREVHLDGAASVCFPRDCFHKALLNDIGNALTGAPKQQAEAGNDITVRQNFKRVLAKELAIEVGHNEENKTRPETMLEICLEANSDTRSVHVPAGTPDEDEKKSAVKPNALANPSSAMDVRVLRTQRGISYPPHPDSGNGSKHAALKRSMKFKKKSAFQFYNLRHTPAPTLVVTTQKTTSGKETIQIDSNDMDQQAAGDEDSVCFNSMEVLSDNKPKFMEWCAEEENQELITNFNAQYVKVQKGWIQLEKEAQPAPKVKNKSDKLKEIWKSKRRTRKFKGPNDVQKLSPVQMLFMKSFDMSSICNWFMETTETKSLVIVKKMNTRLPGDIPLIKLPLQKSSSGIYPSSLQAERLKKHLKKFAAMTPAKNTIKTQRLWTRLRESTEDTEPDQTVSLKQLPPSEVNLEHGPEAKGAQTMPSTATVASSSRILRKYSHLQSKLRGQHKVVKLEQSDCETKQPSGESKTRSKSLCIKPLMSPKLAQQVKNAPLPAKSTLVEKDRKGRRGKSRLQEEAASKGDCQSNRKKALSESNSIQGPLGRSSKDGLPRKKASKLKHLEAPAAKKQKVAEKSNKRAFRPEKAKKPIDSQSGKRKPPTQKGKVKPSQKSPLPSKQAGLTKPRKPKVAQNSSSRSVNLTAKNASRGKALSRPTKRIQENCKAQSKRKLKMQKGSSPSKRKRLDAK